MEQPLVIVSYATHVFHNVFSKVAFWIGVAAVVIVLAMSAVGLALNIFPKIALYVFLDLFLAGFLIVISLLYKRIIEMISNRGQLVMKNDRMAVIHRNGTSEEVKELIAYTGRLMPLMMIRAVTASGRKVNFRMSILPGNRVHTGMSDLAGLAQNAGIGYSEKRYTLTSRWT